MWFCRFRGAVRNLVYGAVTGGIGGGASSVVKPQEIVESKVRGFGFMSWMNIVVLKLWS